MILFSAVSQRWSSDCSGQEWQEVKIKYLSSRIGSGKTPRGGNEVYVASGVLFIRSMNVYDDGLRLDDVVYIDDATDREMSQTRVLASDVLLNITGASIGRTCLVPEGFPPANVNQHVCIVRLHQRADPAFVSYALKSSLIKDQIRALENGSSREGLNFEQVGNMTILLPAACDQQRAIAAFLDRKTGEIDAVIARKERLIALLQEERQALISRAVTRGLDAGAAMKDSGLPWLGEVPKHWEVKKLKYLATVLRGKFTHRPRNDPRFYDGPYPFIQTGDVASADKYITTYAQTLNEAGFAVSKEFPAGTLVMSIAANIGDIAILTFDACFPDSIVGFLPLLPVHEGYLYHLLSSMRDEMLSTATLNTQLNLNIDRILHLEAPLPPPSEQAQIARYIEKQVGETTKIATCIRHQIAKLREYRQALISAAVTGKLAVPLEVSS